ncbi:MAG: SMP-30/gluconolactonase/LRE family protein [Chlorobium sp.]|nr:SMP-30/gluconolactonase/LRE family protein [Chlorobium sp.]MCW8960999.1 SMP-30/gluconolactonase/LRE family protein [Ignavibacteriaceae bacterium]
MRYLFKRFIKAITTSMSLYIITITFITSSANAQFFNGPESVTYDTLNGRYLISNVGNGDIVQISDAGDTTFFDRTLARTLGMVIVDNILYIADISGVVTFDLTTDQKIATIPISEMIELNDITADTSGYLYITDSSAGKVFRMKISDHSCITIASGINIPNGILFDARNNRVLFCQFIVNAPIKQIDLDDLSVSTVLTTSFSFFDGLTIDSGGNIYVSCWGNNAIYRYDNEFSLPAELISSGHNGPADIFYNQLDNILAIPNYYSNLVDFIPITPIGVDELYGWMPQTFSLSQNYPNPFNPATTIKYQIPELSFVTIKVYDVIGNEIETLVNEEKPEGTYEITWNAERLSSGVYFYQLSTEKFADAKKMIILK